MKQFINSCYFIIFSCWTRLVSLKVVLYALIVALVILTIFQHELHSTANMHIQHLYADNDPWNG